MASHNWFEECPYCGFEKMLVSSYRDIYFEVICPICGYARWTDEKIPNAEDVELAKRTISEMKVEEIENVVESYHEENVPLIARLKDEPPSKG